ncbi:YqcC family protein [Pseudoalteromonas sp. SG41-6]|uniref:YqcC family protein n=1 Tax=Pseudoalteromonas sp. SG41-6 TaxID=2760974 RepID=UPI0015FF43CB|nr:YqcC family protein [Pseudoalteromonas sp. SG41-6]MBB1448859.1 YqcC family protein [Pseudoalteromonas sp. SG41-6]
MYQQTQTYLVQLTALLQKHALWQSEPIDADALLSNTPFCHDTMAFEQWLQFVFIEKVQQLITHKQPLPRNFAIAPMAQMTLMNKAVNAEIIELLTALDTFLGEPNE